MTDHDHRLHGFLTGAGWDQAQATPLAGDASARSYQRLTDPDGKHRAVLMDDPSGNTAAFSRLAEHLLHGGLSAPRVLAEEHGAGLMLLEDLGDATFTRLIERDPTQERPLYAAATDLLITLEALPLPDGLDLFDSHRLAELCDLAFSRYAAPITGVDPSGQILPRLEDLFHDHIPTKSVLLHRDFHADNLIWLPDREGPARVGLLDFQDAVAGPGLYDLVSLLQDARRDVSPVVEMAMMDRYRDAMGLDDHDMRAAYAVLGLQRNLRILGVFARLAQDHGKPHYLSLIPRVFDHVMSNLDHPALAPVASTIADALPRPGTEVLAKLKGTE